MVYLFVVYFMTSEEAQKVRDKIFGKTLTYSPKVFVPLTRNCRNKCGYCAFRREDSDPESGYLTPEEVMQIVKLGELKGAAEALITLGERPESVSRKAKLELDQLGFSSTVHYIRFICELILKESNLIPHVNAGILTRDEIKLLKPYCGSMGLMLETHSSRFQQHGFAHEASPGKVPALRIEMLKNASLEKVPFTTGILIGIGESFNERVESLRIIAKIAEAYGAIQEVIIQNFIAHEGTAMANFDEPDHDDILRTITAARLILPESVSLQAPPNLSQGKLEDYIQSGLNDWGGISAVTKDEINPEKSWPEIERLSDIAAKLGYNLKKRLTVYPRYIHNANEWLLEPAKKKILKLAGKTGYLKD